MARANSAELGKMRASTVSKLSTLFVVLAVLGIGAPAFAARQAASSGAAAKPSTARKAPTKTRVMRKRRARPRAQAAPTAARISQIQAALAAQGAYKGQPNGKWDGATIQAMRDFQASHGLTATGKLDALTLQKLGLGSEIAGRAAPLPVTQSQGATPSTQQQQAP
jgi:peptidoglycan hydrolase-like protein with peptidoglycan-binding domain